MRLCRCGRITSGKLCEICQPPPAERGTTAERGYDHRWRELSERIRDEKAVCEICERLGRVRPATECHHVAKVADSPERRLDPTNIFAVCEQCHRDIEGKGVRQIESWIEAQNAASK